MKILISEIPSDGKSYKFNRKSAELNEILSDLPIEDYEIDVFICERGAFFELSGKVDLKVPEVCSKCGDDIRLPIVQSFNDVLIEKLPEERGTSYSKGAGVEESIKSSEVAFYSDDSFDLGAFLHEMLALEIPDYPDCAIKDCPSLLAAQKYMKDLNAESENFEDGEKQSPFSSLKDLKLN